MKQYVSSRQAAWEALAPGKRSQGADQKKLLEEFHPLDELAVGDYAEIERLTQRLKGVAREAGADAN